MLPATVTDSSWEPTASQVGVWVEARFQFQRIVQRIFLAGAPDKDQYVTSFRVLYQAVDNVRYENIFFNESDAYWVRKCCYARCLYGIHVYVTFVCAAKQTTNARTACVLPI